MHDVLFSIKRTFHKSTAFGKRLLVAFGLTPSRFDILYMLKNCDGRSLWQSSIRKALGVTAATTSIMLRALEEGGFVLRERSSGDRRQVDVSLTSAGAAIVAQAIDEVIGS